MDSEALFTILAVIVIVVVKVLLGFLMFKREKPPAESSESMREILESLNQGEARQVIITRDDGKPVRAGDLTSEELLELLEAPEAPKYDANADAALLEEQQRYAALAAQAEARLSARPASAYDMPDVEDEAEQTHDGYAARLPELVRTHARDAVALSILFAPPPGLAK